MAYIRLPTLEEMDPAVREQLERARAKTGDPGEIAYLVAVRPDIFDMTMVMVRTLLLRQTELPYRVKETIALLVSAQNRCDMCVGEHVRIAKLLGMSEAQVEAALGGLDAMDLPESERKLLAFCLRAAGKESYRITPSDVGAVNAAGYSDAQILEAVAVVGYFNYINTISNALGAGK
jgi:uncharacterized peroxidase-related enzyme